MKNKWLDRDTFSMNKYFFLLLDLGNRKIQLRTLRKKKKGGEMGRGSED